MTRSGCGIGAAASHCSCSGAFPAARRGPSLTRTERGWRATDTTRRCGCGLAKFAAPSIAPCASRVAARREPLRKKSGRHSSSEVRGCSMWREWRRQKERLMAEQVQKLFTKDVLVPNPVKADQAHTNALT